MKPFNLQDALAGKPVVTRDGRSIKRIIDLSAELRPVGALSNLLAISSDGSVLWYTLDGRYITHAHPWDLFMATVKTTRWVNVYRDRYGNNELYLQSTSFNTESQALENKCPSLDYVATTSISLEE